MPAFKLDGVCEAITEVSAEHHHVAPIDDRTNIQLEETVHIGAAADESEAVPPSG